MRKAAGMALLSGAGRISLRAGIRTIRPDDL